MCAVLSAPRSEPLSVSTRGKLSKTVFSRNYYISLSVRHDPVRDVMTIVQNMLQRRQCHNDLHFGNICVKRRGSQDMKITLIDFGCSATVGQPVYNVTEPGGQRQASLVGAGTTPCWRFCCEATEVYRLGLLGLNVKTQRERIPQLFTAMDSSSPEPNINRAAFASRRD